MASWRNQSNAQGSARIWNFLSLVALLGIVCFAFVFINIFMNPYSALNPFPPPTLPAKIKLVTRTATATSLLPATWTPVDTVEPTATETLRPTATLFPTATPFTIDVLLSSTPTATTTRPPQGYLYEVQKGSPVAVQNIYHPELECAWMGVGGQVLDLSGAPVVGLIIQLGGSLPGIALPTPMMSLTGVALNYGPSGFEFQLAGKPVASKKTLWTQLLDQEGLPVSDRVFFDTYADCNRNLILINFKQVRP
jgi:hypothetical protein